MILIPRKLVPYVVILLGILGTFVVLTKGQESEKVSATALCVAAAIGGVIWAVIDVRNRKREEERIARERAWVES